MMMVVVFATMLCSANKMQETGKTTMMVMTEKRESGISAWSRRDLTRHLISTTTIAIHIARTELAVVVLLLVLVVLLVVEERAVGGLGLAKVLRVLAAKMLLVAVCT